MSGPESSPTLSSRHVAIALVSASVLLLQIAVTRILSVLLWYHWAFFAISLAMLGMGAPGVWLALSTRRPRLDSVLLAAGALIPCGIAAMIRWQHLFGAMAIVFCMASLLPALLALGTAVCLLLMEAKGPAVSRMYGSDLLGACAGALVVVPLMNIVPTPELAACAGLLPLCAHELVAPPARRRWIGRAAALLVAVSAIAGTPYRIRYTKQYQEAGALQPIFVRWTPTARLAIFPSIPWSPEGFRWGLGTKAAGAPAPQQYWLEQDGSAGTPITHFDGNRRALGHLFYDVTSVGYQLRRPGAVAIVGAGGGRDILTAHLAGADSIDAIELNAGIVSAMRGPFGDFSGHVYDLPGVRPIVGEGRSVLTHSAGGYDLIQISMIDSWAATAAGAYSLSENNLYTLEAYRLYFQRLSPRGVVSTSRWLSIGFGFEIPRLLLLEKAALIAEGVTEPIRHLAVVQAGAVATVLMFKAPLAEADIVALKRVCDGRGFTLALPITPGAQATSLALLHLLSEDTVPLEREGFVLAPPTDDRPFFFQMVSPFHTPAGAVVEKLGFNAQAVGTLRTLMIAMAIVTLLLFFSPFLALRRIERGPGFWNGSGYFLSIGLAFMFLEIGWLQRAVLYLGHPSLAATAALGFMLLGAGGGATLSRRIHQDDAARLGWLLPAVTAAVNLALGPVMSATLGWPLQVRLVLTGVMLVPAGIVMGFAFPLGMVGFGERHKAWYWALNGAASVLSSVVSLALAMELGYLRVGYLGAAMYLPAWLFFRTRERARPLRDALVWASAVPLGLAALWQVVQLGRAFAGRLHYPIDLEWMEGGQMLAAHRMLHGQPVYDACRDGFIPFAYPPVHAALVAAAGALFGLDYPVARGVSIAAFGLACLLLCREVQHSCGKNARGFVAAFVAFGWLAASYPASGAWYDLVRVDSTCLAFLVLGSVLALPRHEQSARHRLPPGRILAAAAAITLSVFAKQTAALFVPWILGFAIGRERRSGLYLTAAVGAMSFALLLALNASSHGLFWTLVFEVMRRHPLLPEQFGNALFRVVLFAPYLPLLPFMAGWLLLRRRLPARTVFWLGMCVIAVIASVITAAKVGAYINNIMTATVFAPPAGMMLGAAWLDRHPRRDLRRALLAGAAASFFALLLAVQRFEVDEFVPNAAEWRAALALRRFVHDLPGGVVFPAHSFLPIREGQKNRQLHEQGYVDVMGSGVDAFDVGQCVAELDGRWLIVNNIAEPHLLTFLGVTYEPRSELPDKVKMLVGKYTVPTKLYERRPGDPWQLDRRDRRELFDFESGTLDGWERAGLAFQPGVTAAQHDYQQPIIGHHGHYLVDSFHPDLLDQATGSLTSPEFTIDRARLGFRFGGGSSKNLRVELVVDGQTVRSARGGGQNIEVLLPAIWDVADLRGRSARLVITDAEPGSWGHLLVDAFELFDPP